VTTEPSKVLASVEAAIPLAEQCERDVIGCVTESRFGAELAHQRLVARDFYLPAAGRAFDASVRPEVVEATTYHARLALIAERADVSRTWLQVCVDERPSFVDLNGVSADRVREASIRRRLQRQGADLFVAAGTGDLSEMQRAAAGEPDVG
jgi:replicative DNA helicase